MENLNAGPKKKGRMKKEKKAKLRILKTRGSTNAFSPSNLIDVHIVGIGGRGFCRGVMINTTFTRYLFNCGEGLQRFLLVNKLKIAKIEHLFLTSSDWSSIGGLIGLLLSLEETGVPKITLHGPPNVEGISSMCRHLGQSDGTQLEKRLLTEESFEDNNFKFQYVPLFYENKQTDEAASMCKKPRLDSVPVEVSVAYICIPKPSERKIDIQKCKELNIRPGPSFNLLKTDGIVTIEDGRVINSDDIMKPLVIPPSFIIVDCPHSGFLTPLIDSEGFKKYQNSDENTPVESKLGLIIHLTPEHIVKLPEYQQWMNSFGDNVKHIVFEEDSFSHVMHQDGSKIQSQLNLLHPELFPLLPALTTPTSTRPDSTGNIIRGENNLKYQIKPDTQLSREFITETNLEDFQTEITNNPKMTEAIQNFKQEVAKFKLELPIDDRVFPEIVFLGTGASTASKYRNFSGILLRLDENNSMLLDCGEGTVSQLYCHYGDKTDAVLRTINGVFISHMHADHHLGLSGIVQARLDAFGKDKDIPSLVVAAPLSMKRWTDYIDLRVYPISAAIKLFPLQRLKSEDKLIIENILKLDDFDPVDVEHCLGAKGVCLKFNGFKLVYSGDTMPCENLVQHGRDCDVLIHEATFDEGMEQEARTKTHSTTTQAIEIGRKMNAKQIILTHFSQRYSKVPIFTEKFTSNVGIAFDHMTIRPCDYPYLSLLTKPLVVLFEDAINEINGVKMKTNQKNASKDEIQQCTSNS